MEVILQSSYGDPPVSPWYPVHTAETAGRHREMCHRGGTRLLVQPGCAVDTTSCYSSDKKDKYRAFVCHYHCSPFGGYLLFPSLSLSFAPKQLKLILELLHLYFLSGQLTSLFN